MSAPYYKSHWIEIDPDRHAIYDDLLKFHPAMQRLLAPLELRAGLSVLDVGSGPGHTAMAIAQRVAPGGRVTGVDINAEFVERAGSRAAAAGLASVLDYKHSEFPPLPFADAGFDRVWCKNVLEYVDDAGATVTEMARVAASGGIVVAVDSDWEMMAVELGEQTRARTDAVLAAARKIAINEPRIGRRLFHLFLAAGLRDIQVEVLARPDRKGLMVGMLRNSMARYARDSGEVPAATVEQWLADIDNALKTGRYLFMLPQFVVSGRKT